MKNKGMMIAAAVAGMMFAGRVMATDAAAPTEAPKKVKCSGVNECKGKGACGGATHDCAGKNECKGKGWISVDTEKECTDKAGTVVKS